MKAYPRKEGQSCSPTKLSLQVRRFTSGDKRGIVTAVDTREGRRRMARADEVVTIWAKSLGRKLVRVSVNSGSKTLSLKVQAEPEEEFSIGDIIGTDKGDAVITKIKTESRMVERGGAEARDIVRVYAKMMRENFDRKSRLLWRARVCPE